MKLELSVAKKMMEENGGDLDLYNIRLFSLFPKGLKVSGSDIVDVPAAINEGDYFWFDGKTCKTLPEDIDADLVIRKTQVDALPKQRCSEIDTDLRVGSTLYMVGLPLTELPEGLTVPGSLTLEWTKVTSLPQGLRVGNSLWAMGAPLESVAFDLIVHENLDIRYTRILGIPSTVQVFGKIVK